MNKFLVGSILCLIPFSAHAMDPNTQVISPNDNQELRDYLRSITSYYQDEANSASTAHAMNQNIQVISPNDDQKLRAYLRSITPYYQDETTSLVPSRQLESPTPSNRSSKIFSSQSAPEQRNKSLSLSKDMVSPAAQSAPAQLQTSYHSVYPIPSIAKILAGGSIFRRGVSTPDLCKASALLGDIGMDKGEESINALTEKSDRAKWLEDNTMKLPLTCTILSYYLRRKTSNNWVVLMSSLKNPRRKKSNSIG